METEYSTSGEEKSLKTNFSSTMTTIHLSKTILFNWFKNDWNTISITVTHTHIHTVNGCSHKSKSGKCPKAFSSFVNITKLKQFPFEHSNTTPFSIQSFRQNKNKCINQFCAKATCGKNEAKKSASNVSGCFSLNFPQCFTFFFLWGYIDYHHHDCKMCAKLGVGTTKPENYSPAFGLVVIRLKSA